MTAPTLSGVRAAFAERLTATGIAVYERVTPADVDTSKPWLVIDWLSGGGREGSPVVPSDMWTIAVRVTAAAQSTTGKAEIPSAVVRAAEWATDVTRGVVLDRTTPIVDADGYRVTAVELQGQGGIVTAGPTVNIPDDYLITVHRD